MKKIIAIILVILMMTLAFASCTKAPNDGGATSDTVADGELQEPVDDADDEADAEEDADENENEEDDEFSEDENLDDEENSNGEEEGGEDDNNDADEDDGKSAGDDALYTKNGKTVEFGYYPQTEVTNYSITSELDEKAGELPTNSNSQKWTSYGYYDNGSTSDYMWYIDVVLDGVKYRGVYFTYYRAKTIDGASSDSNSEQDDNGYYAGSTYWFEYEPITWTIISEKNGTALILCDMVIDSQEYDSISNSYAESAIRRWLNDDFYNTAFNSLQKEMIVTTTVDNSVASTGYSENPYASSNTSDKVFLLSRAEVKDTAYGITSNSSRLKEATDYANAQGKYVDGTNVGWWWLRSPLSSESDIAHRIKTDGSIHSVGVGYTSGGVVPALWIKF